MLESQKQNASLPTVWCGEEGFLPGCKLSLCVHKHLCISVLIDTHTCTQAYTYMYTHELQRQAQEWTSTCSRVHIQTPVHLYSHTCACSTYIYTCACSQIHTHTCPCAHTYILYVYFSLYLKARPLINIWNVLVFLCSSEPNFQNSSLISLYLLLQCQHIPGIFSVQEMHVLMKCHCSLILFSVSGKPSFPSFTQPGSFWGLMKRNDAIMRENLFCVFPVCVILKDRLCTDLPTFSTHSCGPSHTERLVLAHLFLEQTCN